MFGQLDFTNLSQESIGLMDFCTLMKQWYFSSKFMEKQSIDEHKKIIGFFNKFCNYGDYFVIW